MTSHISCRSLTQIALQIPRWRTKWHRNNHAIQNSIELKASAYVLSDICQVAALVDLSRNKTSDKKYSIFARWQHLILPLFGGILHMCISAYVVVRVWLMFVHMCVKRSCLRCMVVKVKEWVTSIEFFIFFSHLLSILHFAVWQLLCWPFLLYMGDWVPNARTGISSVCPQLLITDPLPRVQIRSIPRF